MILNQRPNRRRHIRPRISRAVFRMSEVPAPLLRTGGHGEKGQSGECQKVSENALHELLLCISAARGSPRANAKIEPENRVMLRSTAGRTCFELFTTIRRQPPDWQSPHSKAVRRGLLDEK